MKKHSRRMALCGMMVALGVAAMLLGSVIPLATFCCPAIAGLALLPLLEEYGRGMALGAYAAIAVLSLILSPDKESALLFAFLGEYPALRPALNRIRFTPLRLLAKLGIFDVAAGAMLLCVAFVLNMQSILQEYAAMTRAGLILFAVIANFTLLLYDRLLALMTVIYRKKLRPAWMRGA